MKLSDISDPHEEILVGKGYNEITLHDINLLSMSKSLWKRAKIVSDHEGIQELKKELVLDHSRFCMDGAIAQLQTNLKTHKNLLDESSPEQSIQQQRIRWSFLVSMLLGI